MNIEALRRDHLRRMAEPDDVRELRRQAERIRATHALAVRRFIYDAEREALREEIRKAGETPCR
ncbi:MAG: hypothetical protein PGN33_14175 [Methylobacterium radiotolerans]